jgi:hypothetical protein
MREGADAAEFEDFSGNFPVETEVKHELLRIAGPWPVFEPRVSGM